MGDNLPPAAALIPLQKLHQMHQIISEYSRFHLDFKWLRFTSHFLFDPAQNGGDCSAGAQPSAAVEEHASHLPLRLLLKCDVYPVITADCFTGCIQMSPSILRCS